jgi:hypothetical protein
MTAPSASYRGNPEWRDMSEYAVHFTKPSGATPAYNVIMSILSGGTIRASGPWGAARYARGLGDSQHSACFSEIPLDLLDRLVDRRSAYGIGFHQNFLIDSGGARVWYLDKSGAVSPAFKDLVVEAEYPTVDPSAPLWRLTPFVDYPDPEKPFQFEWEREWRVPGGLDFRPDDVAFLFIPEEQHAAARQFFSDQLVNPTGPAYLCPYVDPRWKDMERIQQALAALADTSMCDYCGGWVQNDYCLVCDRFSAG